jgi:predicted methyltransferase
MKTDLPPIAKTELVRVRPGGERTVLTVEIGQPYKTPEGIWRTPLALHGLDGRLSDICGEDSLQSLCLALSMVHRRLTSVVEAGDRLVDAEGGVFPFEAYFSTT